MTEYSIFRFFRLAKERLAQMPVCIVHGYHEFLGEMVVKRYRTCFLPDRNEFSYRRIYFESREDVDWESVVMELKKSTFFVQSRKLLIVMIRSAQALTLKKSDREILTDYLQNPNPNAFLIVYPSLSISLDDYNNLKKSRIRTFTKLMSEQGALVVDLDSLPEKELVNYVTGRLKKKGVHITRDGTEKILELLGEEPALIIQQLPKFEIYQTRDNQIDSRDVELILTGFQSHSIWDLIRAIEAEDLKKYLKILNYLLINGYKPVFIQGTLISHYHKIYVARILLDKRYPAREIGRQLNQPGFFLQSFIDSVRRIPLHRLHKILDIMYRIDYESKTGGESLARLNLQNFIFRLRMMQG
jgi:DNA polymerase III delta subunit